MSFRGCCGPSMNPDDIIYTCLLHNQEGMFKITSTISHMLCVLLLINGFMSSMLIAILIFLKSKTNSGFCESIFYHCVTSTKCLIIPTSYLYCSLCHRNNYDPFLFTNQRFKKGMIEKYYNNFLDPPFLLLQFSSSSPSFLRTNLQIGHFSSSSYSASRYRMKLFLHVWIFPPPNPTDRLYVFLINSLRDCVALE
jgi:hypothetical protein